MRLAQNAPSPNGITVKARRHRIWRFDSNCLPTRLVHAGDEHRLMTDIAFKAKRSA